MAGGIVGGGHQSIRKAWDLGSIVTSLRDVFGMMGNVGILTYRWEFYGSGGNCR